MPTRRHRPVPAVSRGLSKHSPASLDGLTEALLLAHGVTIGMMVELIRAGLARDGRTGRHEPAHMEVARCGSPMQDALTAAYRSPGTSRWSSPVEQCAALAVGARVTALRIGQR